MNLPDFYRCYDRLLVNWCAFSKPIQAEIERMRHDLHEDLAGWRAGQPGSDLGTYAARVNALCREDGLPAVFSLNSH